MKIKAYRGTRLSQALALLEGNKKSTHTYWITDKDESRPYAEVEKYHDRSMKGAILEANLEIDQDVYHIQPEEYRDFEKNAMKTTAKGRTAIFETETFKVIIIPKERQDVITDAKLVEIV